MNSEINLIKEKDLEKTIEIDFDIENYDINKPSKHEDLEKTIEIDFDIENYDINNTDTITWRDNNE